MTRYDAVYAGGPWVWFWSSGSPRLGAQESRGSLGGLVVDSSGGALPGVTVTIVNNGTNATVVQTTNSAGQYTAVLLLPGAYTVTVEVERLSEARISKRAGARR